MQQSSCRIWADGDQRIVLRTKAEGFAAGQHLHLAAEPGRPHWFDAASGRRIDA
jgi:hypothetical protein